MDMLILSSAENFTSNLGLNPFPAFFHLPALCGSLVMGWQSGLIPRLSTKLLNSEGSLVVFIFYFFSNNEFPGSTNVS